MIKNIVLFVALMISFSFSDEIKIENIEQYIKSFDLQERENMKIKNVEMLNMLEENEAILLDIRFKEEVESWSFTFAKHIPLNELPSRLNELPKNKLIITACPHNDRANLARIYLNLKGFNAKYLSDGLLKTADYLRGDNAVEFINNLNKKREK